LKLIERNNGYFIPVYYKKDFDTTGLQQTKYLAKIKNWFIPKTEQNRKVLQSRGLVAQITVPEDKNIPQHLQKKLPKHLYDVQKEALKYIYNRDGNTLLAYDMGLGKTAIALLYTKIVPRKTVIICQANMKRQWEQQIKLWLGDVTVCTVYGQTPYKLPDTEYTIINYEILKYHVLQCEQLIVDEVQFLSNAKAERTKVFMRLALRTGRTLALSGTPITRRPVQFFPVLHVLMPDIFDTFHHFTKKYCNAHIGSYGWDYNGVSNVEEIKDYLRRVMIRRTKAEALDLPDKLVVPILLTVSDIDTYKEDEKQALTSVFGNGSYLENKKTITYLQYLAYLGKREAMLAWIKDTLENGEKLVVFCTHRKIVEDIHKEIPSVIYYGGMSDNQKRNAINQFKGKKQVLIGNIQALGTGVDGLQDVCSTVVFVELPWTPTAFDQATDRLWRIGQNNHVFVYILIADKTIEENIVKVLDKSRSIVYNMVNDDTEHHMLQKLIQEKRSEIMA
jgi:SWI/SNF-related matrix-associated actin-dependent regulator of chromatin subfamily A-like protein 1